MSKDIARPLEGDAIFEAISTVSIAPGEAFTQIRQYLEKHPSDADAEEAAYEALRDVVWSVVSGRENGPEVDLWGDTLLRVKQLLRSRKSSIWERLTSLADLLEQSGRFSELHPTEIVKTRKHDARILELLYERQGPVERAKILEVLGIREANLSRILLNLASAGLISKRTVGREALFSLTSEGRTVASKLQTNSKNELLKPHLFNDEEAVRALASVWEQTGAAIAITDEDAGLLACDLNFARLIGGDNATQLRGQRVALLRKSLSEKVTGPDEVEPDEVTLVDGRVCRVAEYEAGSKSLWLGFDVTSYKRRIEEARRREKLLLREIELLKSAIGKKKPLSVDSAIAHYNQPHHHLDSMWSILRALRHDILTPINSIVSFAELMKDRDYYLSRPELYQDSVEGICTQGERLRSVVKDLFNASELLEDTSVRAINTFSPAAVIRDVVSNLNYSSRHSNLSIAFVGGEPSEVRTDERFFRGVFLQAVTGILEMLPTGGRVRIEGDIQDQAIKMRISTDSAGWDISTLKNEPTGLIMCGYAVEHFGGQFGYSRAAGNRIITEYLLPVGLGASRSKTTR